MTTPVIWAVFSAFEPSADLAAAVASVRDQVDEVVVVDDGSGPEAAGVLAQLDASGVRVLRLPENQGIAAALNHGMAAAIRAGATAVVTLDQDSRVPPGFVDRLSAAAAAAADDGERVGVVVPEYFAAVRQWRRASGPGYGHARDVIQSGMLIPAQVLDSVGLLRADLFIDCVDTEFELRLLRAGYRVLAAEGLRMDHALGGFYRRELFGRAVRLPLLPPNLTLSTPFRYFYRVRNRIVLIREYGRFEPVRVARDTIIDVLHFADVLRVARPRRAMARVMRAGLNAGIHGRMGRMPAALAGIAADITWAAPAVTREATP